MPADIITIEEMMRRLREFASAHCIERGDFDINGFCLKDTLSSAANVIENLRDQIRDQMKDYDEYAEERRQLIRQLDVAMHGEEGAAKQASLCDLIPLAEQMRHELETLRAGWVLHTQGKLTHSNPHDEIAEKCMVTVTRERLYFSRIGKMAADRILYCLEKLKTHSAEKENASAT